MKKNSVGDNISAETASWNFGKNTAVNFDQHIRRSIPLYQQGHELILRISDFFVNPNSIVYELGCSTGQLTIKLARHHQNKKDTKWIGIDQEPEMIKIAQKNSTKINNVQFENENIGAYPLEKSDLIIAYYVIQFVRPKVRQELFDKIYESLNWGGAFILFEKVRGPDARFQDILTHLYNDYKTEQEFTSDEILAKSRSLRGVLEPFSTEGNLGLLKRSGFVDIMSIMKYICFEGFLAIK